MNYLTILIPILFSINQILVRMGSTKTETLNGIYVSLVASTLLFAPSLYNPTLNSEFIIVMIAAGILHFLIARICYYYAISKIGVNLSAPLSTTRVFFATILSIIFGEEITLKIILASILIFTGVFLLSRIEGKINLIGIVLGILTGFFAALSSYVVRLGNAIDYNPLFATFLGFLFSTILLTPIMIEKSMKNTRLYFIGGLAAGLGHLLRYIVLKDEAVTFVESIISSHPLFTLLLSSIFLRKIEIFTIQSILGTILILTGIYILYF
ncbi:MAG: DMT family transporter [Aigarchaeota archaeon]|nr:DMT family transporter [Candidatus Geocrenenecus dongiae]